MVSSSHAVCAKGLFIAMISTTVETDKPELEIRPALDLLGDILEMFVQVQAFYDPVDDGTKDQVNLLKLIFKSYLSPEATTPLPISKALVMKCLSSIRE